MRGGFRTRSDGQFVAQSPKASQNEIPKQDITDTADSKGATAGQGSSAIPSISLPKGGGAIRGIGEKFTANSVTGTVYINVPIGVSYFKKMLDIFLPDSVMQLNFIENYVVILCKRRETKGGS